MKLRKVSIVALVIVLVSAAGLTSWWLIERTPNPSVSAQKADGPTLYQALAEVNRSTSNLPGGPWGLFSIYGIAAQAPYSPNVEGYPSENRTVNACQAQFNGLTLWNGSIPIFTGTPGSGTAPFWQFAFYSNPSNEILVVTDLLGSVQVFSPMAVNGPCSPWYDLGNPSYWVSELAPFLPDSPTVADSALNAIDVGKVTLESPSVEIFTSGPGVFDGLGDLPGGAGVIFERCGLTGVSGIQPILQWGENLQGNGGSLSNETTNCALLNHPYFAGYGTYALDPGASNVTSFSTTIQVEIPFQVAMLFHNASAPTNFDGWGLANWMTNWSLSSSTGSKLPLGNSSCQSWVLSVSECAADLSGWFVVMVSPNGAWVNSYGQLPQGGMGWSEPVTALVSHQQIVVVCPNSWDVIGATLSVSATVPTTSVTATILL